MSLDQRLRPPSPARTCPEPEVDLDAVRAAARSDRRRNVAVAVAAASVAAIVPGGALLVGTAGPTGRRRRPTCRRTRRAGMSSAPSGLVRRAGLHHGDWSTRAGDSLRWR